MRSISSSWSDWSLNWCFGLFLCRSRCNWLISRWFSQSVRLIVTNFWLTTLSIRWLIFLSFLLWIDQDSFGGWNINVWFVLLLFYISGFGRDNNWRFYLYRFLDLSNLLFVYRIFPWFFRTKTYSFIFVLIQCSTLSHGSVTIFTNWSKIQWFVILVRIFALFLPWFIVNSKIILNGLLISNQILWYHISCYLLDLSDVSWIIKVILKCTIVISLNGSFWRILVQLSFRLRLNFCIVLDILRSSLLWVQRWLVNWSLKALLISRWFTDPLRYYIKTFP